MLVIGLTGPTGAGKGEVSRIFATYGLPVVNADDVYHSLLRPPSSCLTELTQTFGGQILSPNGELDRKKLGHLVFSDPASLQRLNSITHRYIMEEIHRILEHMRRNGIRAAVLDAPQLFEAGANRECGTVVSVLADKQLRLERIMERDGIDVESAVHRMEVQKSDEYFRTHSNYIIENNGSVESLIPAVARILSETGVLSD